MTKHIPHFKEDLERGSVHITTNVSVRNFKSSMVRYTFRFELKKLLHRLDSLLYTCTCKRYNGVVVLLLILFCTVRYTCNTLHFHRASPHCLVTRNTPSNFRTPIRNYRTYIIGEGKLENMGRFPCSVFHVSQRWFYFRWGLHRNAER